MIVLSNTIDQRIRPGESITFDLIVMHTGSGECHKNGSDFIKMKQQGIYDVDFSGNVYTEIDGGIASMAIAQGDQILFETQMESTSYRANEVHNISKRTKVPNNLADKNSKLVVMHTGSENDPDIIVKAGSSFVVRRES